MPQALPSFAPVLNDPFWAGLLAMVLSEAGRATRSAWGMITRHWIPA
jgi:hypothetical protein